MLALASFNSGSKKILYNHFSLYGLNVSSPISLPGTGSDTFRNVTVSMSEQPLHLSSVVASNMQWQYDGRNLLGTVPSLGQALIEGSENVTIYPAPGLCHEHLLTLMLGSGLACSLFHSQYLPLHGAAISTGKGALLFLGASGRGKSTIAITAASAGWQVLTDDVISLNASQPQQPILVYPSHGRFKTQLSTASALGFHTDSIFTTAPGTKKYPCYLPPAFISQQAQPVVAVYFLQPHRTNSQHQLQSLSPMLAIEALSKQLYRPRLASLLKKQPLVLQQHAKLVNQARCYQLALPGLNYCGGLPGYKQWLHDFIQQQSR